MVTRKKISLLLLTAGIVCFLAGILQFNPTGQSEEPWSRVQPIVPITPHNFTNRGLYQHVGLITLGVVLIGMGSYLAGSLRRRPGIHSHTIDFTGKRQTKIV